MLNEQELEYIQIAVDIGALSVSEKGSQRPKPKVGAVLVKNGVVLEKAHRGETGEGHHAEFGLLEKKLKGVNVAGATLYTTLEPCTHRNEPKIPCAERIKDRRIAKVVIGILDPNQNICGRGVRSLRDGGIEVDLFPVSHMNEVEEQNADFIRDQEEYSKKFEQRLSVIPGIGLRLDRAVLDAKLEDKIISFKHKLRLSITNVGEEMLLFKPRWVAGGIEMFGHELGYRYQLKTNGNYGAEVEELDVPRGREFALYIALDSKPNAVLVAPALLSQGTLGSLVIPAVTRNGSKLELVLQPKNS